MGINESEIERQLAEAMTKGDPAWAEVSAFLDGLDSAYPVESVAAFEGRHVSALAREARLLSHAHQPNNRRSMKDLFSFRTHRALIATIAAAVLALTVGVGVASALGINPLARLAPASDPVVTPTPTPSAEPTPEATGEPSDDPSEEADDDNDETTPTPTPTRTHEADEADDDSQEAGDDSDEAGDSSESAGKDDSDDADDADEDEADDHTSDSGDKSSEGDKSGDDDRDDSGDSGKDSGDSQASND